MDTILFCLLVLFGFLVAICFINLVSDLFDMFQNCGFFGKLLFITVGSVLVFLIWQELKSRGFPDFPILDFGSRLLG
jgi:hypothetical protein